MTLFMAIFMAILKINDIDIPRFYMHVVCETNTLNNCIYIETMSNTETFCIHLIISI